jgi:hypothetical protein
VACLVARRDSVLLPQGLGTLYEALKLLCGAAYGSDGSECRDLNR